MVREQNCEPGILPRGMNCDSAAHAAMPMEQELEMQDGTMVFFTAVFFAVAFLYVKACQKLR